MIEDPQIDRRHENRMADVNAISFSSFDEAVIILMADENVTYYEIRQMIQMRLPCLGLPAPDSFRKHPYSGYRQTTVSRYCCPEILLEYMKRNVRFWFAGNAKLPYWE